MAKLIYKEFAGVGKGFEVATSIPPAGLVSVLRAARQGERNKFRYSLEGLIPKEIKIFQIDSLSFNIWNTQRQTVLEKMALITPDSF